MKVLVLSNNYPDNNGSISMFYVHQRNIEYIRQGIDVTELSFSAKQNYIFEGVKVVNYDSWSKSAEKYDIAVLHAPNLRQHYKFLKKHKNEFSQFVFFFHGHEILKINKVYSKPYDFVKVKRFRNFLQNMYDDLKLRVWRKFFKKYSYKSHYIFVSGWMKEQFFKWTKLHEADLLWHTRITYNGIGSSFETTAFDFETEKKYDFLTVRNVLDGSKYCVDIVCSLAEKFPQYKFLLVGRGEYFNHRPKPENVCWLDEFCNHKQIIEYMLQCRCALMPTRTDSQGVMACELASTGMPLITSNLDVCKEVFKNFDNIAYISNENPELNFAEVYGLLANKNYAMNCTYHIKFTVQKEIDLFNELIKS